MGIQFTIQGTRIDWENPDTYVEVGQGNAVFILEALKVPVGEGNLIGDLPSSEMAARCRRILWPEFHDPGTEGSEYGGPGTGHCRVIEGGRAEGYLQRKAKELLGLATKAGDRNIQWA